jgi:hypothetical protein
MTTRIERKTESICRKSFTSFLEKVCFQRNVHWQIVQDDPPDYYLTFDDSKRFAVEVTESKVFRLSILDKAPVSEKTFRAYHKRLIGQIQSEALRRGVLKGTYVIWFRDPIATHLDYKKLIDNLKQEYFEYLQETKLLQRKPFKKLRIDGMWISSIEKIGGETDCIYPALGGNVAWLNSLENKQTVKQALQQAIDGKKSRLDKRCISDEKILLFYDSYLLDDKSTYLSIHDEIGNLEYFHTIFIHLPVDQEGFVFSSKCLEVFMGSKK